ncbi:MAG TPA: hypothetical protein PKA31_01335 [Candidatus Moranbacteria bacterium]|nr:hypothetical protein [Candidatus Moranbacteria bacterium]
MEKRAEFEVLKSEGGVVYGCRISYSSRGKSVRQAALIRQAIILGNYFQNDGRIFFLADEEELSFVGRSSEWQALTESVLCRKDLRMHCSQLSNETTFSVPRGEISGMTMVCKGEAVNEGALAWGNP